LREGGLKVEIPIIAETQIFKDVLLLIRRIYQHPRTPSEVRSFIRFECGRFFNRRIEVKEFLEGGEGRGS